MSSTVLQKKVSSIIQYQAVVTLVLNISGIPFLLNLLAYSEKRG